MVDRFRLVTLGLAIGLLIVLSMSIGTTAGEPDPDELVAKAVDSLENESVEGVHTQKITKPGGEVTQTVAIHRSSSQSGSLEILESSENNTGQQLVFNGSSTRTQIVDNGSEVRYDGMGQFRFDEVRTLGASPGAATNHYQHKYRGTSQVDGRKTHKVELVPPTETTAELSLDIQAGAVDQQVQLHETTERKWYLSRETWWIDAETHHPIKQRVEWTDEDGDVIATARREYEELTVGSAVVNDSHELDATTNGTELSETGANDTFEQSIPQPRKPTPTHIDPRVFSTHQAANVAVPFELPTVDVPTGYTLDRATVESNNDSAAVLLLYRETETDAELSVQVLHNRSSLFYNDLNIYRKSLPNFDGELVVTDSGTEIVRQCDDLTYRVRGPPAAEALIQVTDSIEC